MKQSNARVLSRSAADSKHRVRQQRKPCYQSSDSFLVRPSHSYSTNAATTVKECQRRASTGWQCNRDEHLVHKQAQLVLYLSVIGSQCNSRKAGVTWSPSFRSRTVCAAACKTLCGRAMMSSPANPQE